MICLVRADVHLGAPTVQILWSYIFAILVLMAVIKVIAIAVLSWMLHGCSFHGCWSSLWLIFVETRSSRWILRFVTCCCSYLDTVVLSAWWSFTFRLCPLFFTDEVLPCFAYAVIIAKTVVLKTPGLRLHTLLLNGLPSQFLEIPSSETLVTSRCRQFSIFADYLWSDHLKC